MELCLLSLLDAVGHYSFSSVHLLLPFARLAFLGISTLLVDGLPVVWRCFLSWGAMKVEVAPESSHANGS
jgi:hypothetical protein